jgi:hypothetical protein
VSSVELPALRRGLIGLALVTLPFTQALTVNLRFPLKIYEVALILLLGLSATELRIRTAPGARREFTVLALFVALVAVLVAYRQINPLGMTATGFSSRFGPVGDSLAKLMYILLAIYAFLMFAFEAYRDTEWFTRTWLWGAIACSIYSWYLFAGSLVGVDLPLLPQSSAQRIEVASRLFIRSGTFEEGNFLGLYLLLSVAVALLARRTQLAAYLSATVLTSFSTTSLLGLGLFWIGLAVFGRGPTTRAWSRRTKIALFLGLSLLPLVATGYLEAVVVGKLVGTEAVSRLNRIDFALEGLRMFREHPVTGVGLSQYGYNYNSFQYFVNSSEADLHKLIPNNVYVELLSELGLVATAVFLLFMMMLFRRTRGPELTPLRWGLLALLLVWNAFPTYTLISIWAFFALIVGASARVSPVPALVLAETPAPLAGAAG